MVHSQGEWSCPESDCGTEVAGLAAELLFSGKKNVDRPESYSATHSKNYIYCAEKVAHGLDLISPNFYFVRWKSQMIKILDMYIYWEKIESLSRKRFVMFLLDSYNTIYNTIHRTATVTWLKCCRYGVKLYPINQSIYTERNVTLIWCMILHTGMQYDVCCN